MCIYLILILKASYCWFSNLYYSIVLLLQVLSKDDPPRKTYVYKLSVPVTARWISLAVAPFDVLPDRHSGLLSYLCLPANLPKLRNTVGFFHSAFRFVFTYQMDEFFFKCFFFILSAWFYALMSVLFFHSHYEDYLSASFPFGSYKQVFIAPEMAITPLTLGASMSIFSSQILFDEKVIDQVCLILQLIWLVSCVVFVLWYYGTCSILFVCSNVWFLCTD